MANGDDDISAVMGGQDEGGGMYTEPTNMPSPVDDDDGNRMNKRRTQRRHGRPKFRSERKARRTPR